MLELLYKRRSIRKYLDTRIEQEKVQQLAKAALLSPSSRSLRPWEFIFVEDKEILAQLSTTRDGSRQLKGAALAIVVIADPEKCDVWIEDASIASTIIQLTAESLGLGSCWIQIRERKHSDSESAEQYVREILEIPENIKVESIISIGYPDETKKPNTDDNLNFYKIHLNSFGKSY